MTTTSSISPAVKRAADVLDRIQNIIEHDSGAKATLKRALTGEPRHRRAAYPFVLRYLSESEERYDLEQWLLVTCLLAYYPQDINPDNTNTFGDSARRLTADNSSGGPERRFRALLDTSLEDLSSPLTAIVRLMKSKSISLNYPQLLVDLCRWEHSDQYVQDKWARAFWSAPRADDNHQNSENIADT
ncbi:MAG: type I-E CRISPR-associated protein Cse2/CasB [Cyanobacteria bacterium J06631_9]